MLLHVFDTVIFLAALVLLLYLLTELFIDVTLDSLHREEHMTQTCGHERATFPLNGNFYCAQCAPYAWQAELHRGHADEPPAVPTVPTVERDA